MNDQAAILRTVDANGNRAREALRVMEDFARFTLNDQAVAGKLKALRHGLAEVIAAEAFRGAVLWRDTPGDVGTANKTGQEMTRASLASIIIAAGKRLSEALRVIEECAKTVDPQLARKTELLRYRGYALEQTLARITGNAGARERFAKIRLYVLLTEAFCHPESGGWERTLDELLAEAAACGAGHSLCIQLREKDLADGELLRRAKILVEKCRRAGALSIINDRADIALLSGADGIHVGQQDMPCAEARKLLGMDKVIGVSTERIAQAREAVRDGATYVAVGPMFETTTKEKPRIAGVGYAREVLAELQGIVPVVAIGGITLGKLDELQRAGVACVCACGAVIGVQDVREAVRGFLQRLASVGGR